MITMGTKVGHDVAAMDELLMGFCDDLERAMNRVDSMIADGLEDAVVDDAVRSKDWQFDQMLKALDQGLVETPRVRERVDEVVSSWSCLVEMMGLGYHWARTYPELFPWGER